ncbi:MAG: transposase, partial [Pseudonocardiaceae bacterium]
MLGVDHTVIESVTVEGAEGAETVVVKVRPTASRRRWCSKCGLSAPGYDSGDGRRRWRALDLGTVIVELEADAPRVCCGFDGVVVAAVPWARAGSRFTTSFEQTCAWLAANASGSAVAELLRVTWRSVTAIVERVVADALAGSDRLDGVTRVGIDEIAHRKGHRYLTAVTDHDTGRLIWAAPGRSQAVVEAFFDALGAERSAKISHVSADGAEWIHA